ncbi:MAG: iron-containing alcohol dehydrogenase [Hydrogenibacillus schlegelii]|uniref:Iron-containing alcohol dehydrogenase n=1 Tax=Hydrogenibacillus schlegelii TaxID=1484 RepID=A0A947GH31_HYDSH|nr:iron-containing alcohol dehydrogenase [Hydrogenibacillus schlegelii]
MQSFQFYNPTRLIFGRGAVERLPEFLGGIRRVLFLYGGGSIKRNGAYEDVTRVLKQAGVEWVEVSGVEPNPRVGTVRRAAAIAREARVEAVVAVGGGSVLDAAKGVAVAAVGEADIWDVVLGRATPEAALPVYAVLTLAATGSEMNKNSVLTNEATKEKYGWSSELVYPRASFLDPAYTLTVPKDQTVYGIVDMMSHIFEQYFHTVENTPVTDRLAEGLLRAIVETAPKLVERLDDLALRETILLAGTVALNGTLSMGVQGDWATHNIEHAVSALFDIPHAAGLAILFPHWMRHVYRVRPERWANLATRVFGVDPAGKSVDDLALAAIERLEAFWQGLGAPARLREFGITEADVEAIVEKSLARRGPFGHFMTLDADDVRAIVRAAL